MHEPVESSFGRAMLGKTQDVFRSVINSRKSYKRATEAVWPPQLEEALLKGMFRTLDVHLVTLIILIGFATYQPEDYRETRMLGRFPMRNQFISDYIFQTTGERRSAKQVGSRLQQLRGYVRGEAA
jgi:transcriptional enhancer factor